MTLTRITIAELLANDFNRTRLACIRADEESSPVSALSRYRRTARYSQAPPIVVAYDGTILDGCHRVLVAAFAGQTDIAAERHTLAE